MKEKKIQRLDEYTKQLLEKRRSEIIKMDMINQFNERKGRGLTSPTTSTSTEETRLFMEYMDRSNLLNISKRDQKRGKVLTLLKFFKTKRNQQVEVYSVCGAEPLYTEGKVNTIGRDFVMLTNLKERIWIPYSVIESANIPYGIPNYSNTHQHYIYDNDLRNKLVKNFGETVSKKDFLKQQFYEETLQTNLDSWKGTWVEIYDHQGNKKIGKIGTVKDLKLILSSYKKEEVVLLKDVHFIQTIRFFASIVHILKKFTGIKDN